MTITQAPRSQAHQPRPGAGSRRIEGRRRGRAERARVTQALLERAHTTTDEDARRALLDDVIVANLEVAQAVARRYRRRGVPDEDLEQAAYEGLVKAVLRFDPDQDNDLLTYAVPTVRGEVQRYFRDRSWMVRPPRRVQELQWQINRTLEHLTNELSREPTDREVREAMGIDDESFRQALAGFGCFHPASLDRPVSESGLSLGDSLSDDGAIGGLDSLGAAEARATLEPALRTLSDRDRELLRLRFVEERTQEDIGALLGVTQMQVSRLLARILRDLRLQVGATCQS